MQEPGEVSSTIANDARRLADHIEKLPERMRAFLDADPKPDPSEVREALEPSRLSIDAFRIHNLIEIQWSPDHAKTFVSRILQLEDGLKEFLRAYAVTLDPSAGMAFDRLELGKFFVVATLTAENIRGWADAIESLPSRSKEPAEGPRGFAELTTKMDNLLYLAGDLDKVERRIKEHLERSDLPAQQAMLRALRIPRADG